MKVLQEMTAVRLLQLKAIKFQPKNPFIWANGWTAPMYCDDRKILSYPKMRDFIRLELARVIAEMYPDADIIAGVATNAIAHGVLVAEQLSLPFVYVHPTPKDHGLENQIEGDLRPRQRIFRGNRNRYIRDDDISSRSRRRNDSRRSGTRRANT